MSDNWGNYFTLVADKLTSVLLDLEAGSALGILADPHLILIRISLKSSNPDGLSTDEEFPELCLVDDAIRELAQLPRPYIYVGRITSQGERTFFVYTEGDSRSGLDEIKAFLAQKISDYPFFFALRKDPDCSGYLQFLSPLPEEMQTIQNQRIIQTLLQHDDDLSQPRPVDHFVYFPSAAKREEFKQKIANLEIGSWQESERGEETSKEYCLNFVKVSAVDLPTIDKIVITFFRLAQESNGEYDGWGAPIIKK